MSEEDTSIRIEDAIDIIETEDHRLRWNRWFGPVIIPFMPRVVPDIDYEWVMRVFGRRYGIWFVANVPVDAHSIAARDVGLVGYLARRFEYGAKLIATGDAIRMDPQPPRDWKGPDDGLV